MKASLGLLLPGIGSGGVESGLNLGEGGGSQQSDGA